MYINHDRAKRLFYFLNWPPLHSHRPQANPFCCSHRKIKGNSDRTKGRRKISYEIENAAIFSITRVRKGRLRQQTFRMRVAYKILFLVLGFARLLIFPETRFGWHPFLCHLAEKIYVTGFSPTPIALFRYSLTFVLC